MKGKSLYGISYTFCGNLIVITEITQNAIGWAGYGSVAGIMSVVFVDIEVEVFSSLSDVAGTLLILLALLFSLIP